MSDVLDTVCAGSEIVMKAVPGDNHPTYHWNEDTTNKTNSMSFTPAYDAKAAYPKDTVFHFIAVENLLGCTDTSWSKFMFVVWSSLQELMWWRVRMEHWLFRGISRKCVFGLDNRWKRIPVEGGCLHL